MQQIELDTPIGRIIRANPYSEMSNLQVIEYAVKIEKETGFINPSILQEIENRGIYAAYSAFRSA